jgi:hypothetical protein
VPSPTSLSNKKYIFLLEAFEGVLDNAITPCGLSKSGLLLYIERAPDKCCPLRVGPDVSKGLFCHPQGCFEIIEPIVRDGYNPLSKSGTIIDGWVQSDYSFPKILF